MGDTEYYVCPKCKKHIHINDGYSEKEENDIVTYTCPYCYHEWKRLEK